MNKLVGGSQVTTGWMGLGNRIWIIFVFIYGYYIHIRGYIIEVYNWLIENNCHNNVLKLLALKLII